MKLFNKKSPAQRAWRLVVLACLFVVIILQSLNAPAFSATPASPADLSNADRTLAVQQLATILAEHYVLPNVAASLATSLKQAETAGHFDHIQHQAQFVDEVGQWLREQSKDGHLGLELTKDYGEVTHVRHETDEKRINNYAFEQLKILPGNIGYLKMNKFVQANEAFAMASHALHFVSRSDALIIDLRESVGGSPELVRFLVSHFVPAKTVLWRLQDRQSVELTEVKAISLPNVEALQQMPLYILQHKNLASAGEFFGYTLQQQGRATIIGETSAGLAHYTGAMAVNDWLFVRIPLSRPLFPKTSDNFEQRGVKPDIVVTADAALTRALLEIRQR